MNLCFTFFIGSRTVTCVTEQGECIYRYFVGTTTTDQQPPIVFEGECKKLYIIFLSQAIL